MYVKRFDDGLSGEVHIDLRLSISENCLEVDDTASEESLNDYRFSTNHYWNFDNSALNNVNKIDVFTLFDERITLILFVSDKFINNLVEDCVCVLEILEERQLLEGHLDEPHVLVFVVKDALFDILEDERVFQSDLIKVLLAQFSNSAILASNDGCCSHTIVD